MEITNETQIITICPACSSQELHDVLKRRGSDQLVRCTECGSVHNVALQTQAAPETTSVRIIVSAGEDSAQYNIELPLDHEVYTGDELLVDDPSADEVHLAEVASVESRGARVISALAADIDTIWSRAIDKVTVKVAIHDGKKTRSVRLQEYGDREFRLSESRHGNVDFGNIMAILSVQRILSGYLREGPKSGSVLNRGLSMHQRFHKIQ